LEFETRRRDDWDEEEEERGERGERGRLGLGVRVGEVGSLLEFWLVFTSPALFPPASTCFAAPSAPADAGFEFGGGEEERRREEEEWKERKVSIEEDGRKPAAIFPSLLLAARFTNPVPAAVEFTATWMKGAEDVERGRRSERARKEDAEEDVMMGRLSRRQCIMAAIGLPCVQLIRRSAAAAGECERGDGREGRKRGNSEGRVYDWRHQTVKTREQLQRQRMRRLSADGHSILTGAVRKQSLLMRE
jgi:hypothetical protein